MQKAFFVWLTIFGGLVTVIGAAHLFVGQPSYIGGGHVNATMDSDLRFYSLLFVAYGLAFVWVGRDVARRRRELDILGLLFFLGGLARVLAWSASGPPNLFYIAMVPVELVIPIVHFAVSRRLVQRTVAA